MSQKTFVCDDCGLKFDYEDISVNEVSICKSCSEEEIDTVKKFKQKICLHEAISIELSKISIELWRAVIPRTTRRCLSWIIQCFSRIIQCLTP